MSPLAPRQTFSGKRTQGDKWLSIYGGAPLLQMGYANPDQVGGGLLSRLYSRAFIVADLEGSKRVVFVSADIGMVSQRVRLEVRGWKGGAGCLQSSPQSMAARWLLPLGFPWGGAVSLLGKSFGLLSR